MLVGKIGTLSDSDEKNRYKWVYDLYNLEKQRQVATGLEVEHLNF